MVKKINADQMNEVLSSKAALIDFSATWCNPCKMLAPVLEELSKDMEGKVDFYNMDVDDNQEIAQEYDISSIPALLIFKDGKIAGQAIGFQPKDALIEFINSHI